MVYKDYTIINGHFFFDPDDLIYNDHFPGNPIVPGSLIIQAFIDALSKNGFNQSSLIIKNFKFKQFVVPGKYNYKIYESANKIICKLFNQNSIEMVGGVFLL